MKKISVRSSDGKRNFDACEEYNARLERMETNIAKLTKGKSGKRFKTSDYDRWYKEAKQTYTNNSNDQILYEKLRRDLCVIIPTHKYHRPWLKACLESVSKLGYLTILSYDNPFFKDGQPLNTLLPSPDALRIADHILFKPKTWHSGVTIPHVWNMIFAINQAYMLGFEYVFRINGDFIMERPENFEKLRGMMKDADIFPLAWNPKKPSCGTAAFIAKVEHQHNFWREFAREIYKPKGNAEARMGKYYIDNKLKVAHFEPGPLSHQMPNETSTWYKTVGLRHLHAENKLRRWNKLEPIEEEYVEEQFLNGFERNTILKYWKSKDKKYLEMWWEGGVKK